MCPVIGPKKSFPILTFDNLGRPNGKNELPVKSKEVCKRHVNWRKGGNKIYETENCGKDVKSGNDEDQHWWQERRPLAPEKKDYDHEGND